MELKDTLNLPETDFPMRGNLVTREPERLAHWAEVELYRKISEKMSGNPLFMLHDGPPFTNGDVHIGTALNKIVKDIILRYKTMRGFWTPYVPGWDCHGLPIEHKVVRGLREAGKSFDVMELRRECARFSRDYSAKQRRQFQRLGLLADWENEYRTMDPAYEASVFEFLACCVEKNLVYRSKKPIYWSIPCKTALAEAEIEYKNLLSPSIWVKFTLSEDGRKKLGLELPTHFVAWTTTPWTLPANLALAIHGQFRYVALAHGGEIFLIAEQLVSDFIQACEWSDTPIVSTFSGRSLVGLETFHPFIDRLSPVLLADFVTADRGTGCVHIAPGHGMEDYLLGLKNNLPPYCPLDDDSCYVDDGSIPASLVGLSVAEKNGSNAANEAVLGLLREGNKLLAMRPIEHSYPHCWRSKTPLIFRAMDQWFIRLEGNDVKTRCEATISGVNWLPDWGENRIRGALEARPDWCISRQRVWGTPLPVFFDDAGQAYLDASVIRALGEKIRRHGSDFWFENTVEELLSGIDLPSSWKGKRLQKSQDTVDVWIDSGMSFHAVLQKNEGLTFPADLYCEGSDQHRGWFQSSLICSMIVNDCAPYRAILTHGFIVGEDKKKISKSDGKPQTADDYVNRYGADVVRLWIASEDFRNDVTISDSILQHIAGSYQTIRNTFRFLLGNLADFDPARDTIEPIFAVDRWARGRLGLLVSQVTAAYDSYEFHRVFRLINQFVTVVLSATYHDLLKDRLYTCSGAPRRSAQTVLYQILETLIRLLAPILTFTCDEVKSYLHGGQEFSDTPVQLLDWPVLDLSEEMVEVNDLDRLFGLRDQVNTVVEAARRDKIVGKSLEVWLEISGAADDPDFQLLKKYRDDLAEIFIVSRVSLVLSTTDKNLEIRATRASGERCCRCWRWLGDELLSTNWGGICDRCQKALLEKSSTVIKLRGSKEESDE